MLKKEEEVLTKTISFIFDGYWREKNIASIPNKSGIYGVYICKYNPVKEGNKDTVTLKKLIYLGQAEKVQDHISKHKKWEKWRKELSENEQICFSFSAKTSPDRERGECALIFYHKPICNNKCKKLFPHEDTTVISSANVNLFHLQ